MYNNYNYNPYYQPNRFMSTPQPQTVQPMQTTMDLQNVQPRASLLGEIVDNLEMVNVSRVPTDGSVSFFPLSDGSMIATKQLQMDGKSKITIYKPVEQPKQETPSYVTKTDLNELLGDFNINDLTDMKSELESLKKQIKELTKKGKE